MAIEERPHWLVQQGDIPSQRAASRFETRPEIHHVRWLTPRLLRLSLTIILLGTLAGVAGALFVPRTYGARAEILYTSGVPEQSGDPLLQDRQLSTQVVLLKGRAVLAPVAKKQGRQFEDVDKDIDASIVGNSNVIQVEASGPTEPVAMQTLQAVVDGYLALASQPSGVARNLNAQLVQARQNTAQLQTRVAQLRTAVLAGTTNQTVLDNARAQVTASSDWEKILQARINEVALTDQGQSTAQVLTPPYALPDSMVNTPRLIAAGAGTVASLIVAGVVLTTAASRAQRQALDASRQARRPEEGRTPVQHSADS